MIWGLGGLLDYRVRSRVSPIYGEEGAREWCFEGHGRDNFRTWLEVVPGSQWGFQIVRTESTLKSRTALLRSSLKRTRAANGKPKHPLLKCPSSIRGARQIKPSPNSRPVDYGYQEVTYLPYFMMASTATRLACNTSLGRFSQHYMYDIIVYNGGKL